MGALQPVMVSVSRDSFFQSRTNGKMKDEKGHATALKEFLSNYSTIASASNITLVVDGFVR